MEKHEYTAKKLYAKLETERNAFLRRARENSEYSQPQIFPPEGSSGNTQYRTPFQSLGARGVNNLANKITLSLFPPNQSFAKLSVSPALLAATGRSEGEINMKLYEIEKELMQEMELTHLRPKLVELFKKELVGGNMILNIPDEGNPKLYSLEQIVVKRSKSGEMLKTVIKEGITFNELSEEDQNLLRVDIDEDCIHHDKPLDMYTMIVLIGKNKYKVHQEINEKILPGTEGEYLKKDLPYIFIPFVDRGEDYGRSYLEDYLGDLISLEGLSKSMLEGSAESARFLYTIAPNSMITPEDLEKLPSGSAIYAEKDSIQVLQSNKSLDLSITKQQIDTLRRDLSLAFLLDSAVQRDAERVTAEEIKKVTQELETMFGGIYSTLANTLQEPLVRLYMKRLIKQGKFPEILKDSLNLNITTGSAALGRGAEFQTLTTFISTLFNSLGPENFGRYLITNEFMDRLAYSLGINTKGLIKSTQQIQEEMAAEQQAAMQQQAIGPAIQAQAQQRAGQK